MTATRHPKVDLSFEDFGEDSINIEMSSSSHYPYENLSNSSIANFPKSSLAFPTRDAMEKMWNEFSTKDNVLTGYMEELMNAAREQVLSIQQVMLFIMKIRGKTYKDIRSLINSKGDAAVCRLLERTALGIRWDGDNLGRFSVLSDIDKEIFKKHIHAAMNDINCIATCTANCLVTQLNKIRLKKARYLLKCAGCEQLAG